MDERIKENSKGKGSIKQKKKKKLSGIKELDKSFFTNSIKIGLIKNVVMLMPFWILNQIFWHHKCLIKGAKLK